MTYPYIYIYIHIIVLLTGINYYITFDFVQIPTIKINFTLCFGFVFLKNINFEKFFFS